MGLLRPTTPASTNPVVSTRVRRPILPMTLTIVVVALLGLSGRQSAALEPLGADGAALVATTTLPYDPAMPFALLEVGTDQIATAPGLGSDYLVKSFSPGMNPVAYLDHAAARGWKVILYFNSTVDYGAGAVYPTRVAAWVNQVKNHPALAGYLTVKEPSWNGISVSEMRSLRNAFRAADANPAHRIFADFGDSPHFGTSANPWATGIADVLIMNWYPVRISKGYVPDAVKWFPRVRHIVDTLTQNTDLWVMAQTFGAKAFDQRMPTAAELERQVGEAIRFARVEGLVFHTWRNSLYQYVLGASSTLQTRLASIISRTRAGMLVVPMTWDFTRPVMTRLSVAWSSTLGKWLVRFSASDISGIARYQVRWRVGTQVWHYLYRSVGSVALAFPRGTIKIQVRAQDKAGNWSYWRTTYRY
jgi:hypothetical protein